MSILDQLSFQLYSARKFPPLDTQLATLARLGYSKVEPYGGLFADADGLAAGLKRHGLTAPSAHVSLDQLKKDLDGFARQAACMGTKLVIVPAIPPEERSKDAEGWRAFGRSLAEIGTKLEKHGMQLAWHNHDFEFRKVADGAYPLDLMFDAAPSLLWEADIGWLHAAGEDPARWLEKYRDRIRALHIKDAAPAGEKAEEDGWTDIGAGVIDWKKLLPAMQATKADLYVLEHDNPANFESFARNSRAAIAAW